MTCAAATAPDIASAAPCGLDQMCHQEPSVSPLCPGRRSPPLGSLCAGPAGT